MKKTLLAVVTMFAMAFAFFAPAALAEPAVSTKAAAVQVQPAVTVSADEFDRLCVTAAPASVLSLVAHTETFRQNSAPVQVAALHSLSAPVSFGLSPGKNAIRQDGRT